MHGRKWQRQVAKRVYPTYEPYIASLDSEGDVYSQNSVDKSETPPDKMKNPSFEDFPDLAGDPAPRDFFAQLGPRTSNHVRGFRPLLLLQSLFSDRIDFLHRSLEELDAARQERE